MKKLLSCVLVLAFAVVAAAAAAAAADDVDSTFENTGIRLALKIYDDCSRSEGFSPCLKKKAITFLDRLGRMDSFALAEGVAVSRVADAAAAPPEPALTEEQLETSLPRAADAKDDALTGMLFDKATKFITSRSIEVKLPKFSLAEIEEGRGKKMKGMMGSMMMGIAAKMAALVPIAIAGLFLLAGKALITAKIALLISGIIAIKKLFAMKHGGGGHVEHAVYDPHSGGHGDHGGWGRRSLEEAHKMAYKAYSPK